MLVAVTLDTSAFAEGLRRCLGEIQSGANEALSRAAALTVQAASQTTSFRDRTGTLRASIGAGAVADWAVFVSAGAAYAGFVEEGTRQHGEGKYQIPRNPRPGHVVRFEVAGQVFFRRVVWHPGIRPRHFMRDAGRTIGPIFFQLVGASTERAIQAFSR